MRPNVWFEKLVLNIWDDENQTSKLEVINVCQKVLSEYVVSFYFNSQKIKL